MNEFGFRCSCCGEWHSEMPDLAFRAPLFWNESEGSRGADDVLTTDLCILGPHRFIRCTLRIPIAGHERSLGWGLWVSQSQENFDLYRREADAHAGHRSFGYLANRLPLYPDTVNLSTMAVWQSEGRRPLIEIEPSDHPLFADSVEGVSFERAVKFAELVLHPKV
jgi:hypothetical protein